MDTYSKIYVAGHRGLVGSALMRRLTTPSARHGEGGLSSPSPLTGEGRGGGEKRYTSLVTRTHAELDLTDQAAIDTFFARQMPDYVLLANNTCMAMDYHE